jgi:hypothetical protein
MKFDFEPQAFKPVVVALGEAAKLQFSKSDPMVKSAIETGINTVVLSINGLLDGLNATVDGGTLRMSAAPEEMRGGKAYNANDARAFMTSLQSLGKPELSANCTNKLLENPRIVEALEHLGSEDQYKAASSEQILDRLIQILKDWGPLFLRIAIAILPLLL